MKNLLAVAVAGVTIASLCPSAAISQTPVAPVVEAMLMQGKLDDARKQLDAQIAADADDADARFALGVVQTLSGVEGLMQSLHEYGLNPVWQTMLPFMRMPVPPNPDAKPLTNEAFRQILADFSADLAEAEATLAEIEGADVKLPMHIGTFRLDFNSDGVADEQEALWIIFNRILNQGRRRGGIDQQQAEQFVIAFDTADVYWLRGYCHVLQALCEMHLAYDTREIHDHVAHLFFPKADVRHRFGGGPPDGNAMTGWILDAIAFVHLLKLPVAEPQRLETARRHMLEVIALSRQSWQAIEGETDDDREWVPSPSQSNTAIPGAAITGAMVGGWREALDEFELLLNGKKLVPFWREPANGQPRRGVNLKKIFTEPHEFDLVMWMQGSGMEPYLEEGEITDLQQWGRIRSNFQGQFFWFAIWVN